MNAALLATPSGGTVFVSVFLGTLFAMFGYRLSVRNQIVRGVTPWKIPSFGWAIICLLIGPIGIAVELLANVTTRPVAGRQVATRPVADRQVATRPAGPSANSYPRLPATPFPAASPSAPPMLVPTVPVAPKHAAPTPDASGKTALFGWYADVTGRHEMRYWDGRGWTALVCDGGVVAENPL